MAFASPFQAAFQKAFPQAGGAEVVNLIYDTFARANGALGNTETTGPLGEVCAAYAWTGGTWTINTNKALNTPTLAGDLVTNGSMEGANPENNWTPASSAVVAAEAEERTGGAGIQSLSLTNGAASSGRATQALVAAVGTWVYFQGWLKNSYAEMYIGNINGGIPILTINSIGAAWTFGTLTGLRTSGLVLTVKCTSATLGQEVLFDDLQVFPLSLPELFATVNPGIVAATYSVGVTLGDSTQGGLSLCLDSASDPSAGIMVYHDFHSRFHAYKFTTIAGVKTYTSLINEVVAYGAGKVVKAILTTAAGHVYLDAFYDGVQISTQKDITDAAIISNTIHGLFSTYSGNTFDNFTIDWR